MLDFSTEFGGRVSRQLESELTMWLTTVGRDNTPQPRPVWFLWDGMSILIYSQSDTHKLRHLARSDKVSLNFSTDPDAREVVVLTGEARVDTEAPPADRHPEYLEKYRKGIAGIGLTPEGFALDYSVAIKVTPTRLRGS